MSSILTNLPLMRSPVWCLALFGALATAFPAIAAGTYDASFESRYSNFSDRQTLSSFSDTAIGAGQYDQALSTLEQIIFAEPNDIEARISIARVYYHVGSFDLALGHINEALALGQGSSFELEIIELKKLIEKAASGVRAYLDVTLGVDYAYYRVEPNLLPAIEADGVGANVFLDGVVEFDLNTASRDLITLSGGGSYFYSLADLDFDTDFERFDTANGYGAITLSKGLPDLVDTLRLDISAYGEIAELGAGRQLQELGVRTRLGMRPTVETILYTDFNYSWLGESTGLFADHDYEYGVGGQFRFAPGWTAAAYIGRTHRQGYVPASSILGTDLSYDIASTEVEASLTHLLFVFNDGRSWFQRLSGRYADGDILDYRTVDSLTPTTVPRREWQINWDHTVQTSTNGQLQIGAGYKNAIVNEGGFDETKTDAVTVRALYTHRFQ